MPAPFVPAPDVVDKAVCYRCHMVREAPIDLAWHALWRHGWARFTDVLLEVNAGTRPDRFVAAVLAAGGVLALAVGTVLTAAFRAVVALFT